MAYIDGSTSKSGATLEAEGRTYADAAAAASLTAAVKNTGGGREVYRTVASASGSQTVDLALGNEHRWTLTGVTWSYDSASDQVRLDFDDPSWTFSGTRTWRYGPLYIDTAGADSTDPVVGYLDWGTDQTVSTPYTLTIDPAGLLYIDIT